MHQVLRKSGSLASKFLLLFFCCLFASQIHAALLVSTVTDEGQEAFKIETRSAVYHLQKQSGGLSSMLDKDGVDWIDYHPAKSGVSGTLNQYRGIPNMGSTFFHPGANGHKTTLVSQDKDKIVFSSTKESSEIQWEFYETHAVLTVIKHPQTYWFLYEGAVGGKMEQDHDYFFSSKHTERVGCNNKNTHYGDLLSPEWACYGDPTKKRVLFLAHHNDDTITDMISGGKEMTIFGFGRGTSYSTSYLKNTPNKFSFGFIETDDYSVIKTNVESVINGAMTSVKPIHRVISISKEYSNTATTTVFSLNGKSITNSSLFAHQIAYAQGNKRKTALYFYTNK